MKNCMVIDLDRCSGCDTCPAACKHANGLPLGILYNHVEHRECGEWPRPQQYWLPMGCQHCDNAPCMEVCPTGATFRDDEFGLILVDQDSCIGCQLCMQACTFDARVYNEETGKVEKCNGCIDRLRKGEKPACVHNCCTGSRIFGDLDDPESDAAKAVAAADPAAIHYLDGGDAQPSTVYILSEKTAPWMG